MVPETEPHGSDPGPKGGNMTAEMAGKAAVEGAWVTLGKLKEQWVLLVFLTGALLWARDTYDEFAKLPSLVRQQMSGLSTLEATVTRLEVEVKRRLTEDHAPVLGFPGTKHGIDDGAPGAWTVLHWRPVERLRYDCAASVIDAWMVDQNGQWFSVETAVAPMPALEGVADLAFGVRVHPLMGRGRARVLVQITFDCGTHRQVETAPWLQFRVLGD
jgi:hypothetical protein